MLALTASPQNKKQSKARPLRSFEAADNTRGH